METASRQRKRVAVALGGGLARGGLLAALWLLFVGKVEPAEFVAAGACAVAALAADALVRARTRTGLRLRWSWLVQAFGVPRSMLAGTARLGRALVARLGGRDLPAGIRSVAFDLSGRRAAVAGRRSLTVLLANLSPDVIVVEITGDASDGRLVYHHLDHPAVPRVARRLGAAP